MGANAQTAVPAFVAGEILTAAEMTQVNTGIPVFATTVTRDAAFGGTGEKVLAEGQYAYIEATNTTQFYDGTSWINLPLAGLVPIVPTSVTVGGGTATVGANGQVTFTSATTSLSLNGVFSSAYNNYRIVYRSTYATDGALQARLRISGTDTSTNYTRTWFFSNTTSLTVQNQSDTSFLFSISGCTSRFTSFDVLAPFLTNQTGVLGTTQERNNAGTLGIATYAHSQTASTSFDGITFLNDTAQTGTVSVYGYTI